MPTMKECGITRAFDWSARIRTEDLWPAPVQPFAETLFRAVEARSRGRSVGSQHACGAKSRALASAQSPLTSTGVAVILRLAITQLALTVDLESFNTLLEAQLLLDDCSPTRRSDH
jgi:hypothetical protein